MSWKHKWHGSVYLSRHIQLDCEFTW